MKKNPQETLQLLDPQQALRSYLDALLSEVPDGQAGFGEQVEVADTVPTVTPVRVEGEQAEADRAANVQGLTVSSKLAGSVLPGQQSSTENTKALNPEAAGRIAAEATPAADLPDWTRTEFQSLSFKVAGITLATPLVRLNGIVELTEDLTELPGYAPWVMGILTNRGRKVQVVDLAQIIMPDGHRVEPAPVKDRAHYVILINNGNFGLAADSLSQVLTLQPQDVRWRTERSRRPWLAGMVIDQMCAILDIDCLNEQLAKGLKIPVNET